MKRSDLSEKTIKNELTKAMDDTRSSIALMDCMALFKSQNATVHDLAAAVGFDPTISQTLLTEVNSPHFSLPNRVKDISHAISLLGFKRTQEVVASNTKHEMYEQVENSYFEMVSFKRHNIAVGCFAEQIARHLRLTNPKEFYKAGTLHDIGKYFYLTRAPSQFEELVKLARKDKIPLFQVERQNLKTDHAELGAMMAQQWQMPDTICMAVRYHHELPAKIEDKLTTRETQMVKVVSYANLLSHGKQSAEGSTGKRVSIEDLPPAPGLITDDDLGKIILSAEAQYKEECELAGLSA